MDNREEVKKRFVRVRSSDDKIEIASETRVESERPPSLPSLSSPGTAVGRGQSGMQA